MSGFVTVVIGVGAVMALAAMGIVAWRLVVGPTHADRIVALDVMAMAMVAAVGIIALRDGEAELLDVAVATSLIAFLSTTAVAWYIQRRGDHRSPR